MRNGLRHNLEWSTPDLSNGVSPFLRRSRPDRCHSLPPLAAPEDDRGEPKRMAIFATLHASRPGSKSRPGSSCAELPKSALLKAEQYGRACTKQGIIPVSLDVAARMIMKQPASQALVGDKQVVAWCTSGLLDDQRDVQLRDADIGEAGASAIATRLGRGVVTLDLAGNSIGSSGAAAIGRAHTPNLEVLNLSRNGLGDTAIQMLCAGLGQLEAPQLRRLCLSENQIARAGRAIGDILGTQKSLNLLDLHWNYLTGDSAAGLFRGLQANLEHGGCLARLDLSWNCLGNTAGIAAMTALASALRAECPLVHLDLSYNSLRAEECGVLGSGLRDNHTLLGLHLVGNAAAVDADGFVVAGDGTVATGLRPASGPSELLAASDMVMSQHFVTVEERRAIASCFQSIDVDGSGSIEPEELRKVMQALGIQTTLDDATRLITRVRARGKRTSLDLDEFTSLMESLILRERHKNWEEGRDKRLEMERERSGLEARTSCWICESWQPVEIKWEGEATAVWAYTSLDNYQRATKLTKEADGIFRCTRMLPPDQIGVILQVDNGVGLASGQESALLPEPITIKLRGAEELPAANEATMTVTEVSVLQLGCKKPTKGMPVSQPVLKRTVIVDDPSNPGGFVVKPRITEREFQAKKKKVVWEFHNSIFGSWRFENPRLHAATLNADWPHTKWHKFLKQKEDADGAMEALQAVLGPFLRLFRRCAASSSDGSTGFGVSMSTCSELLTSCGVMDDQFCRAADVDTMFIAARVREKGADKRPFAMKAGDTLLRFQFLEFLLRVAIARFVKTKEVQTTGEAVHRLFGVLEQHVRPVSTDLEEFLAAFHIEACDIVLRANESALVLLFKTRSGRWAKPGEDPLMCCKEFESVLISGDVFNEAFLARDVPYAFLMGMQVYPDELFSLDFAQMNFLEFLHGLGAVAYLRRENGPLAARLSRLVSVLLQANGQGMMGLLRGLR